MGVNNLAHLISAPFKRLTRCSLADYTVYIRNVKGEITRDEVSQLLEAHYANMPKTETKLSHGLDGDYEIIPPDSPRIKEIEEYNRKLRPALYAQLDKEREMQTLL